MAVRVRVPLAARMSHRRGGNQLPVASAVISSSRHYLAAVQLLRCGFFVSALLPAARGRRAGGVKERFTKRIPPRLGCRCALPDGQFRTAAEAVLHCRAGCFGAQDGPLRNRLSHRLLQEVEALAKYYYMIPGLPWAQAYGGWRVSPVRHTACAFRPPSSSRLVSAWPAAAVAKREVKLAGMTA